MRYVRTDGSGPPEVLSLTEGPCPRPGPGELLLRVTAAGVCYADVMQRRGLYPPPPGASPVLGLEVAGEVVEVGDVASGWNAGDRGMGLVSGGGYAEYCVVPVGQMLPVPAGWTDAEAASLPENLFTVWTNVFERAHLMSGEVLLVHGGAGGIGSTAIMLGRAMGARVLATAGSAAKCQFCRQIGAHAAFDYHETDFVPAVLEATNQHGADVVLDIVAGEYIERDLRALALDGRIVVIAFLGAPRATLDVMTLLRKRATITGSTLRARSPEQKASIARAVQKHVFSLLESRVIRPVIDSSFPLAEAAAAHRRLEAGQHMGKIVLVC